MLMLWSGRDILARAKNVRYPDLTAENRQLMCQHTAGNGKNSRLRHSNVRESKRQSTQDPSYATRPY